MLQIFVNARYDFIGKRHWAYALSALVTLAGLAHIAYQGGLRYGIDFSGGTLVQARFERAITVENVRRALERVGLGDSVIQEFGENREYLVRVPASAGGLEEVSKRVEEALRQTGLPGFEVRRLEFVGPQVGKDLQWDALMAVLWGMVGILVYTAVRFDFKGGVAAILALIHDVLVALAALSVGGREMSLPVLAALLTIVGYSINDTIVVFDRIREHRGRGIRKGESFQDLVNTALNQTLSRTVLTSLTVLLVVAVLYVFGGEVLRDFAFVLLAGIMTGTYSTVFVAAAVVVDWENWQAARQAGGRDGGKRAAKNPVAKAGASRYTK